jgi:hypothetical protein
MGPVIQRAAALIAVVLFGLLPSSAQAQVKLTTLEREVITRRDGFTQGVAAGLISTGAVTAGLSALPFLSGADWARTDDFGLLRGGIQIGVGGLLALAGLGGIAGGAYLSSEFSRKMPQDPRLRAMWKAARLKGLGLMLSLQGMINIAVAVPFLVLGDETLDTLTGNVPLSRTVGQIDLAVGAAHLLAGVTLGLIGHLWDPRAFTKLVIAPSAGPDQAGLTLQVAF